MSKTYFHPRWNQQLSYFETSYVMLFQLYVTSCQQNHFSPLSPPLYNLHTAHNINTKWFRFQAGCSFFFHRQLYVHKFWRSRTVFPSTEWFRKPKKNKTKWYLSHLQMTATRGFQSFFFSYFTTFMSFFSLHSLQKQGKNCATMQNR